LTARCRERTSGLFWSALASRGRGSLRVMPGLLEVCPVSLCAVTEPFRPFVAARNKCIAPKQRRIERLTAGYAVREFRDDSEGRYWYVVTALEVIADQ
jgi:hypothetical protein